MESYAILIAVVVIAWTFYQLRRRKLPPGPTPLPVVGNMLQIIGGQPHQTLAKLSKTYGPVMSLHLGSIFTVVVSSPEMVKEILQKYGQGFSGRPVAQAVHAQDHHKFSFAFLPVVNPKWRAMRKICQEQMFGNHSLEATQGLRQVYLQQLLEYVQKCSVAGRAVDIREAGFITTLNITSTTLFSFQATEFESKATQEFKEIIDGAGTAVGVFNFADFIPVLKHFDPQGVQSRVNYYFGKVLAKIDGYLVERLESRRTNPDAPKKNDLLETLIDISEENDYQLTHDDIKHLLMDLFLGGPDTTTTTIEWIMSDLLLNPDKLAKLKQELKNVVGEKNQVQESDIPRLPYLQAVIKEELRYRPPAPLLFPRAALSDQQVGGYLIPKGTQIVTNAWAMCRDPNIWPNAESFEPERFLDKRTDFKGQDFELVPFGAGRRICPGLPFANRILHMIPAILVHNFDWKLEVEARDADNRGELIGFTVHRVVPLTAIPIKP